MVKRLIGSRQTVTYGQVKYCEDEDDCFTNLETEFPAIVFDDTLTFDAELSFERTVSPLNENEIYFRILFDESDDEDYTVIFEKNSFSYKIISVDNLKTNLENDNDKVDMPSFPSPEPTVSYFDDLHYFKDFEKEFPAIVYNDALTSKLDSLTEPAISPHHIDELDLKNDDDEINIIQSSEGNAINIDTKGSNKLLETSHDRIRKIFNVRSFIMDLKGNIVGWNCLNNWMPINLIKNLYVPIGIPFHPKRFYKDGIYTK
ncbi:hypothetical protein Tco_0027803 [Tanacetum coccineum]